MNKLVFSAIAASNFFSVNLLVIVAAMVGNELLAAEISLAQAAVMAVFYALSANARNLILSREEGWSEIFFKLRVFLLLPAIMICYLLGWLTDIPISVLSLLLLRKASEWLADIRFASDERLQNKKSAWPYLLVNTGIFLGVLLAIFFQLNWMPAGLLWAVLPAVFIKWQFFEIKHTAITFAQFKTFFPHVGSTTAIAISTLIFRLIIVWLVGKSIAGDLFAAFAIGGIIASVYLHAVGPAFLERAKSEPYAIVSVTILHVVLGLLLVLEQYGHDSSNIFALACGYSLIGGGLMLLAQRLRLRLIQLEHAQTFRQDVLSNFALIMLVPLTYWLFGVHGVSTAFFWAGSLSLLFYSFRSKTI